MSEQINNNSTQTIDSEQPVYAEKPFEQKRYVTCLVCDCILTDGQKFCHNCGTVVEEKPISLKTVCSNCGAEIMPETRFCHSCGATIEKPPVLKNLVCTSCGNEFSSEMKFCPSCGKQALYMDSVITNKKSKNTKKFLLIGSVAAAIIAIVAIIVICLLSIEVPVKDIVLSKTKVELKIGETKTISCTVYPERASNKEVVWSSSNNSVATVNSSGKITAVGRGTCSITAHAGEHIETIEVKVEAKVNFKNLYDDYCKSIWATLGSDGSYLSLDSNPYDYDDGDYRYSSVVCDAVEDINKALNLPDSLYEDMLQTAWSMGKQSETYEKIGITVTWTYHPDKGLEVTYKKITD